jgi:hypothetical protein
MSSTCLPHAACVRARVSAACSGGEQRQRRGAAGAAAAAAGGRFQMGSSQQPQTLTREQQLADIEVC